MLAVLPDPKNELHFSINDNFPLPSAPSLQRSSGMSNPLYNQDRSFH
jgi:hypothetical protein